MFSKLTLRLNNLLPPIWFLVLSIPVVPIVYVLSISGYWLCLLLLIVYLMMILGILLTQRATFITINQSAHKLSQGDLTTRIDSAQSEQQSIYKSFNRVGEDISRTTFF